MSDKIKKISASPKVRKFARELGVDINQVTGSQRIGRVIEKDLKDFVSLTLNNNSESTNRKKEKVIKSEYNHSEFGEVEIKDIPRVKRIAAPHLSNSWINIPHVTNHDEACLLYTSELPTNREV